MSVLARAGANLRRWRDFPEQFVVEQFGVHPDEWQRDALRAFADPTKQRISLQACVGPGKTAVLAWCGWNFLSCYGDKGEHPKGVAFSITWDNLSDNLWPELAKWQDRSEYLKAAFTWTKERVFAKQHPETWFLAARSWPKTATADSQGKTLSGLHGKYILVLGDETGAVPVTVMRAGEQVFSSTTLAFGKFLQAGNPISLDGMLYAAATTNRHQWHVIRITGDPDDPKRSPKIDLAWAREQIATYGRDNPWVKAQLLGQFPPASINAMFSVDAIETAMARHLTEDQYTWAQKRLGVDVARYGDDRTVLFPRQGLAAFRPRVERHARGSAVSVDIANWVMKAKLTWGSELELFDATGGWAAGAVDVMRAAGHAPIDVQFAAPAFDPRYYNRRAEIYFGGLAWLDAGGALPPLPEMTREMTAITYTFHKGKFMLEDKDMIKRRLGISPDLTDAWALTFGMVEMPGQALAAVGAGGRQSGHATTMEDATNADT